MSQTFQTNSPANNSLLLSSTMRENFMSLFTSHSGESAPSYGESGVFWYKPSTKTLYFFATNHFEPFLKFDASGNVESLLDPKLADLIVEHAFSAEGSFTTTKVNGKTSTLTTTTSMGFVRTETYNRDAQNKVISITKTIATLGWTRTMVFVKDASNHTVGGNVI